MRCIYTLYDAVTWNEMVKVEGIYTFIQFKGIHTGHIERYPYFISKEGLIHWQHLNGLSSHDGDAWLRQIWDDKKHLFIRLGDLL